jgi:hypothetical protein
LREFVPNLKVEGHKKIKEQIRVPNVNVQERKNV